MKTFMLAILGPAYAVYLLISAKDAFRADILNAADKQWTEKATPYIVQRDLEYMTLNNKLDEQGKDIREIRVFLMGKDK